MLVLTRRPKQSIQIGNQITVSVIKISGNRVQLGIEAPRGVNIVRSELIDAERRVSQVDEPAHNASATAEAGSQLDAEQLGLHLQMLDCPLQQFLFAP